MKKNKQIKMPWEVKIATLGSLVLLPVITFAVRTVKDVIDLAIAYLGYVIPFIISLSIVFFIWGIYKYYFRVDTDKKEAGQFILWGIVGLFVMVSFWGLVNILVRTFNLETGIPGIPTISVPGGGGSGSVYGGSTSGSGSVYGGNTSGSGSVYGGSTSGSGSVYGGSTEGSGSVYGGSTSDTPGLGEDKAPDPVGGSI